MSVASRAGRPPAFVIFGGLSGLARNVGIAGGARARGLRVVVIGRAADADRLARRMANPGHPLHAVAEYHPVSAGGEVAVAAAARLQHSLDVRGVCALDEDLAQSAGFAADLFGVCSAGLRATRVAAARHLQLAYLSELAPEHVVVLPQDRARAAGSAPDGALVVRATDCRSPSLARAAPDRLSLPEVLGGYPADEVLLVESRAAGPAFALTSLVQDRVLRFAGVIEQHRAQHHGQHRGLDLAAGQIESAHTVLAGAADPVRRAVMAANAVAIARLAVNDAVVHAEFRLADGAPVLTDIGVLAPGEGIGKLYELATGCDLDDLLLRVCLGEQIEEPKVVRFARQVDLRTAPGRLRDVVLDWPGVAPWWLAEHDFWPPLPAAVSSGSARLCALPVLRARGEPVGIPSGAGDRVAMALIDGPDAAALDHLQGRLSERTRVELETEISA